MKQDTAIRQCHDFADLVKWWDLQRVGSPGVDEVAVHVGAQQLRAQQMAQTQLLQIRFRHEPVASMRKS